MALQGSLDTFSLPDVLRLLATTKKTGRLRIDGDRGQGSVWLREGGVIDADATRTLDGTPRDEVVFELLRYGRGDFAFDDSAAGATDGQPEAVESLLQRADVLLGEWSELEAVVPSLEHEVTLASDLSADEVTIGADSWRTLVAVSSGRTVGELATTLGLTELGVSRAVRDLVDIGVVEVDRGSGRRSPETPAPRPPEARPTGPAKPPAEAPRRQPAGSAPDSLGAPVIPPAGSRAGWIAERTGEVPSTPGEPAPRSGSGPVPRSGSAPAPRSGSGPAPRSESAPAPRTDRPASPPEPPPAPPVKGGLTSRLGRNRNGSSPGRGAAPGAGAKSRVNGTGNGSGAPSPADAPTSRKQDAEPPPTRETPAVPPPADTPSPLDTSRLDTGPLDQGRLGPPPVGPDTGRIRPVSSSSLPPEMNWAGDDDLDGPITGPHTSPFAGLSSLGPTPPPAPPIDDTDVSPHVAAMSPEAQAAVQRTVGGSGGSRGGGPSQGQDIAQRGRLISFLSSIR